MLYEGEQLTSNEAESTVSLPINTKYLSKLENTVSRRVFQTSADRVFWDNGTFSLLKLFVGIVYIYSNKAENFLKASGLIAYLVHAILVIFRNE